MNKLKKLDNFSLKIIACATMLIDHIGYVFVFDLPTDVANLLRIIGRISFPIFAFLLVQGFIHTKDRIYYLARILGFGFALTIGLALVTRIFGIEVPTQLNIFITLGFGIIALWWIEYYWETSSVVTSLVLLFWLVLADTIHVDYGSYGVLMIILFYATRKNPIAMVLSFIGLNIVNSGLDVLRVENANLNQLYSVMSLPLILAYNGEIGRRGGKYLFYAFYPLHFIFLYIIKYIFY
ncbi:conjugal transfer protein TraX [Erysipelotrichaceae bacterium]|nr:conjugal transfer protein TraX [Erysipelotrichaceae bacterium]